MMSTSGCEQHPAAAGCVQKKAAGTGPAGDSGPPEGEGLRTAPELSVSATAQPILRILYAADSHGALHPCPS